MQRDIAKHIIREYGTLGARVLKLGHESQTNVRVCEE